MNSRELMHAAMRRKPAGCISAMPQICRDLPVRLHAGETGSGWIDGMKRCVEEPGLIYDLMIRLVRQTRCDGLRLFVKPEPAHVERDGDQLMVLDPRTGERTGRIDAHVCTTMRQGLSWRLEHAWTGNALGQDNTARSTPGKSSCAPDYKRCFCT